MEHYSAIKGKLIQATMWMKLEHIMLNEKKSDMKGHIVYESIYMKCPEQVSP